MEMQQQKAGNQTQNEEDVLNFDLDDISLEDIDQQAPAKEEEIIELTDLVARGMPIEDKGTAEPVKDGQLSSDEEALKLLGEDLVELESAAAKKGTVETDVADFALELDLSDGEKPAAPQAEPTEEIVSGEDLEAILNDEEPLELIPEKEVISDEKALEEIVALSDLEEEPEQKSTDLPDVIGDDIMEEEAAGLESAAEPEKTVEVPPFKEPEEPVRLGLVGLDEEKEPFVDETPAAAAAPVAAGISEERLEAIVTKVVQDVLERVARETMTSVAERVIGEAIESLKKSLSENP